MNYEQKYNEMLDAARYWHDVSEGDIPAVLEEIFPELAESEDDRMRKTIIDFLKNIEEENESYLIFGNTTTTDMIAWLEKQGKCETDCHSNHQDANHPNGCITLEDFNGGEGFYKVHLDYLNEKQVEEIEEMIRTWNKESKVPNENIKSCIGMCLTDVGEQRFKDYNTSLKDCLAWLEKQGKQKSIDDLTQQEVMDIAVAKCFEHSGQKPVDKVEPKFKNGQWIVFNGLTLYVNEVVQGYYRTTSIGGIPNSYDWNIDNVARLWSIEDAKDGDILVSQHNKPFIYNGNYNEYKVGAYCGIDTVEEFFIDARAEKCWTNNESINPATKEQRDILFQKMHEAGYTFDFEKKELKKIEDEEYDGEDYGIDSLYHAQRILEKTLGSVDGYQTDDGILSHKCAITAVKKLYGQKSAAWSEKYIADVFEKVGLAKIVREQSNDNLTNALQDAMFELSKIMPQPKQEWSEKDSPYYDDICEILINLLHSETAYVNKDAIQKDLDWLNSIKQRHTWKPSIEQMEALWCATEKYLESDNAKVVELRGKVLESLYNDLKRLRDE